MNEPDSASADWENAAPVPIVPGKPILGNVLDIKSEPFRFLEECAEKYGSVYQLKLAGQAMYIAWAPEDLRTLLFDTGKIFGRASKTPMERVVGKSILVTEGEDWRRLRLMASPAFLAKSTASLVDELEKPLDRMLGHFAEAAETGKGLDVEAETSQCFFDFICRAIFGTQRPEAAEDLTNSTAAILDEVARTWIRPVNPPMWIPTPANLRFKRARQTFDRIILSLIEERRNDPADRTDLLSLLMKANEEPEEGLVPLSEEELRNEVASYLIAGYETTATTMMWTLVLLAEHPEIAERLYKEISDDSVSPTEEHPFLDAVLNESMRLYPAAYALPREPRKNVTLSGYKIPAHSRVLVMLYLTHRDTNHWERPDEFIPDRFLNESETRHKDAFAPFGIGPHKCVGMRIALPLLRSTLSGIISQFRLSLAGQRPGPLPRVTLRCTSSPILHFQKR